MYNRYRRALGRAQSLPGAVGPVTRNVRTGVLKTPVKTDVAPLGSAFGLPHLARFTKGPRVDVGVGAHLTGRRASPVFFKVPAAAPDSYCGVVASRALPPSRHARLCLCSRAVEVRIPV